MKTRQEIINEAIRIRDESQDILNTADHWNNVHPDETPLDADPDGMLAKIIKGVNEMLANARRHGFIVVPKELADSAGRETE